MFWKPSQTPEDRIELIESVTTKCSSCKALMLYGDAFCVTEETSTYMHLSDFIYYCHKCKPDYDYIDVEGKKYIHKKREVK